MNMLMRRGGGVVSTLPLAVGEGGVYNTAVGGKCFINTVEAGWRRITSAYSLPAALNMLPCVSVVTYTF